MNTAETSAMRSELVWVKSSYSGAEGGQCVEVAEAAEVLYVRDSKQFDGPVLSVGREAWARFLLVATTPRA